MNARTLPVSRWLCSCCTTSSMCSLARAGNFAASLSTTSPSARNSSLTPIGKVSGFRPTPSRLDYQGAVACRPVDFTGGRRRAPGRARGHGRVLHADAPADVPPSSVRVQPPGPRRPGPSLGTGPRSHRTVLNPPLFRPDVAPFLPPRLPFGPVDAGQDGQRHGNPQERRPQHQGDFQLSAHGHNFRPHRAPANPCGPH